MLASRIALRAGIPRLFHSSSVAMVSKGDSIPSVNVFDGAPDAKVNLSTELASGKYIVLGVPGAFSTGCTAVHIPSYLNKESAFRDMGIQGVYVLAVNDAFVTKAWQDSLNTTSFTKVLADPSGEFAKAWDVLFDASKFFGNQRSKRYAVVVNNGKVEQAFVEPDNTSVDVSSGEKVLERL